jgi:hypothetical protein
MMMMPDKKNSAALIVAKIKPEKPEEMASSPESQSDYSVAKEDAAKKIMAAFEKKDAKMLASNLQDFMDMCDMEEDSSESESGMDD